MVESLTKERDDLQEKYTSMLESRATIFFEKEVGHPRSMNHLPPLTPFRFNNSFPFFFLFNSLFQVLEPGA